MHFTINGAGLTGGGSATSAIDASSVKLASAWSVEPQPPAVFEVGLYSDVHVPDVKVKVYSQATPSVVVFESDGSTAVDQGVSSDAIQVRLSSQPTGPETVNLGDNGAGLIFYSLNPDGSSPVTSLSFGTSTWNTFQTVYVNGVDDGVIRSFHRADLAATATGPTRYNSYLSTVTIGDDNYPGVTVNESGGSTNVIEYSSGDFGVSQATADGVNFPSQDSYTLALTMKPGASEIVTVTTEAQPTRTSETGGIVSFSQQLDVSLDGITWGPSVDVHFNADGSGGNHQWNVPVTVYVRAHENDRVDGGDTKVFAQQLAQLNAIQGPLFINGGEGADRTGLLEREPVMLPGEKNLTPSMGLVITSTPGTLDNTIAATVTIEHSQLATISIEADVGTNNSVQEVAVNATTGTFTLSYNGHTTGALAFDAPSVTVEDALRPFIQGYDPSADVTVAQNGNVYQVTILHPSLTPLTLGHDDSSLGPLTPGQLVNETILITQGPAKNKTRIVTGAIDNHDNVNPRLTTWTLTLDKPWFSPFTQDGSTPTSDSQYTLMSTNPNLLVSEETQANLLFLYDTDNPASYDDTGNPLTNPNHHTGAAFASGQIFYDPNPFGPKNESGIVSPLDQFRITGFGMGANRCVGGPAAPINGSDVEANACSGPVGANEPGGITFQLITDLQLELGNGNNHVTVDTFTNVPDGSRAPQTQIDTGGGNDVVDVKGITGHTMVNLGAGNDTLNVHNDAQTLTELAALLTASGDSPQATAINYANGSARQGTSVDPVDAIQILTVQATGGSYTLTLNGHTTAAIAWDASAVAVTSALEAIGGIGNFDVQRAGGTYRIHFQNGLGGQVVPLLVTDPTGLTNGAGEKDVLNISDTGATADDAALLTSTSLTGLDMPVSNATQQLVVDATSGSYTLTYSYAVEPTNLKAVQSSSGTLHAGTHFYVVTGKTTAGESLPSNEASAVTAEDGSVVLTWDPMPGATDYVVYRGSAEGGENVAIDTHSTSTTYTDTGTAAGTAVPHPPTVGAVFAQQMTTSLAWNASAATVQSALEALSAIGARNVVVTQNDDTYTINFVGSLSDTALQTLTTTTALFKSNENLGGGTTPIAGTAVVTARAPGSSDPEVNQVQLLHVTATSGTYELEFHIAGVPVITAPIAYNASAEQVRQTIQNAVAAVESSDPNVQAFLVDKLDVWVSQYPSAYLNEDVYVLNFQGELRKEQFGPGVDTVAVVASTLNAGGTATITTRMDGIDYYGFEQVNIGTGSGSDVFNVEGTTQGSNGFVLGGGVAGLPIAQTNISLNNGDDRVYLSSNANLDQSSWNGFDFLTGNLDDFRGALNIDLGAGRQRLFISDEGSSHPDSVRDHPLAIERHAAIRARPEPRDERQHLHSRAPVCPGSRTRPPATSSTASTTGRAPAPTASTSMPRSPTAPSARRRSSTPASATTTSRST